jgi:hypothetical protein
MLFLHEQFSVHYNIRKLGTAKQEMAETGLDTHPPASHAYLPYQKQCYRPSKKVTGDFRLAMAIL